MPNALEVSFGDGVRNEHRLHTGETESADIRPDVRVGLWRRGLRLFPSRFPVKRKRPPRENIVAPVEPARGKVCAIKKNLQPSGGFDLSLAWGSWLWRLLLRGRWDNGAGNQQCDDHKPIYSIHSNASRRSTIIAVLRHETCVPG